MDATELAHWRYRIKALEAELPQWKRWASDARFDARSNPELEGFQALAQDASDSLEATKWLLEEAKYKAELGALLVPPVPHSEPGTTGTTG